MRLYYSGRKGYAKESNWLFIVTLCCALASPLLAFDTGHHQDLTRNVLGDLGFRREAIDSVGVANWLVDYYESRPALGPLEPKVQAAHEAMANLHFDRLYTEQEVRHYWNQLVVNSRIAIMQSARSGDKLRGIAIMGATLHAVQDFYSHSNWAELHPRKEGESFRTEIWFDDRNCNGLHTGYTGNRNNKPPEAKEDHGGYLDGLNHDSYVRPRWDEAYVFAYSGSVHWMNCLKTWSDSVSQEYWQSLQNFAGYGGLSRDVEAAYRISEWLNLGGHNGSWKGPGSGHNIEFINAARGFALGADSQLVSIFKDADFLRLTSSLYDRRNPAGDIDLPKVKIDGKAVMVVTTRVEDLGSVDFRLTQGDADFYAQISIDGQQFVESMQFNKKIVEAYSPAQNAVWVTLKIVPLTFRESKITYALLDEDGGSNEDDHCDINEKQGSEPPNRDLNFTFDHVSLQCSGDVAGLITAPERCASKSGHESDQDRCRVTFYLRCVELAPK